MKKWPSINQFRNVIRHVQQQTRYVGKGENGEAVFDHSKPLPTLRFLGTTKLHGTNAAVSYDTLTKKITYQSRERVLTLEQDNAGFMLAQKKHEDLWRELFEACPDYPTNITYYGEWCGRGIQKGVAVSELDKMFVIFGYREDYDDGTHRYFRYHSEDEDYSEFAEEIKIPGVYDIDTVGPTYTVDIDFNYPELAQQKMIDLTLEVERECPVGKHFGVSGVGEGIVWACWEPGWSGDTGTWLKSKGSAHSTSKVKTLAPVDVEAVENTRQFVESVVTEARLEWALSNLITEQLLSVEMSNMGAFIRTVIADVMKEESDIIVANGLDIKKINSAISNKARPWFIQKVNEGVGL